MNVFVIKRDGSREPFSHSKIARVTEAAGLTSEQAQELGKKVALWLQTDKMTEVTSLQLRDKVLELLKSTDEYAANMFEWYQKTKK